MVSITEADNFFQTHPLREKYLSFTDNERSSTLNVAQTDVMTAFDSDDIPEEYRDLLISAVAEQTIFLLLNPEYLTGKYENISSENVSGSRRDFQDDPSLLCRRAAMIIAKLRKLLTVETEDDVEKEESVDSPVEVKPGSITIYRG